MRLIRPAGWIAQPWKNGGGVTHEVARGGGADWSHRISVAEVASEGPFSRFDGVDRWLMLLAGAGFRLEAAGWSRTVDRPFEPFAFAGEVAITCRLLGGPVRDFNVMTRRSEASARVEIVRIGPEPRSLRLGSLAHYLLLLRGAGRITRRAESTLAGPLDCAAFDGGYGEAGEARVTADGAEALVASIAIDR